MIPIKPAEIRKGDILRAKWDTPPTMGPHKGLLAIEFEAEADNFTDRSGVTYYLIKRPQPEVQLPARPELGWVETKYGAKILGYWFANKDGNVAQRHNGDRWNIDTEVVGFTPAVVFPEADVPEGQYIVQYEVNDPHMWETVAYRHFENVKDARTHEKSLVSRGVVHPDTKTRVVKRVVIDTVVQD